ncbi:hypothetical protein J3458_012302 [Metarhizium acridum]|uniref:uncharacterized protein n=1 Tax=Metarhizium acridum TaxID=92637 RepID=UPI001C6CC37D|nr:hypothetical protein J3458_012302 [Metarhizium acridum]
MKNGDVHGLAEDFFLQSNKGPRALAMHHWNVDVEDAEEAVCLVFDPRRVPRSCPGHSLRKRNRRYWAAPVQNPSADACNGLNGTTQIKLASNAVPAFIKEDEIGWSNELLQSPSPRSPSATPKGRQVRFLTILWQVGQETKHTVDFLYQRNMELIASESLALDDLSMQQVSTQIYRTPRESWQIQP